jgi:glycosyltransferase involved in cell wall biosynthesis
VWTQAERRNNLKAQTKNRLLIYDTDGANPYGRELSALLCNVFQVVVLAPVQTGWSPPGVSVRRILPSNLPSGKVAQIVRQLHGLAAAACAAAAGATVLVVMTRGWYDQLAFALLALLRARVVVIAHDPKPKQALPLVADFSRRLLWRRVSALVTHSDALAAEATAAAGRPAVVVPHLPFLEYAAWAREAVPDSQSASRCRLLVLGQLRPDKGLDRIPHILGHLPASDRDRISIAFAGKGDCSDIVAAVADLITVLGEPSKDQLSDLEIAAVLAQSDLLIAPYRLVTASGTVVLALSRGLRVIAYDTGALSDVVARDGLVPIGDEGEFANRIMEATRSEKGGPAQAFAAWKKQSLFSWVQCLNAVRGRERGSQGLSYSATRQLG